MDLTQPVDLAGILDLQRTQWQERILMEEEIAANSTQLVQVNVSSVGHFGLQWMTGHYTCLYDVDQTVTDTDVVYLSGRLSDSGRIQLFDSQIPFDLWLSPGRTRDQAAWDGAPESGDLFVPTEFVHVFAANSTIQLEVTNTSNYANSFAICFHGVRQRAIAANRI